MVKYHISWDISQQWSNIRYPGIYLNKNIRYLILELLKCIMLKGCEGCGQDACFLFMGWIKSENILLEKFNKF